MFPKLQAGCRPAAFPSVEMGQAATPKNLPKTGGQFTKLADGNVHSHESTGSG